MVSNNRNASGYADPTVAEVIKNTAKQQRIKYTADKLREDLMRTALYCGFAITGLKLTPIGRDFR